MTTNKLLTIIGLCLLTLTFGVSYAGAEWDEDFDWDTTESNSDYHADFFENEPANVTDRSAGVVETPNNGEYWDEDFDWDTTENNEDYHAEFFDNEPNDTARNVGVAKINNNNADWEKENQEYGAENYGEFNDEKTTGENNTIKGNKMVCCTYDSEGNMIMKKIGSQ